VKFKNQRNFNIFGISHWPASQPTGHSQPQPASQQASQPQPASQPASASNRAWITFGTKSFPEVQNLGCNFGNAFFQAFNSRKQPAGRPASQAANPIFRWT